MNTEATTDVEALQNELVSLQARQAEIKAQIRTQRSRKSRTTGRAPREGSLTSNLLAYLASNGPMDAGDIITHFTAQGSNVKTTSVRTLISALASQGKIIRSGKRGTYQYSVVAEASA